MPSMRVLISARDLDRRIGELAAAITAQYRPTASPPLPPRQPQQPLLVIGVLKGAVLFTADLVRRLDLPLELDFVQLASYGRGGTQRGETRLRKDLDLDPAGRDVLVVEDIVDSGQSMLALLDLLRLRGASSVRVCALLGKAEAPQVDVPIDYLGFTIGNDFVVGYGLDHNELHRNLPYIAVWDAAAPEVRENPETPENPATPETAAAPPPRSDPAMEFHHTDRAPAAVGPYSQAVSSDGWLYTAGQVGLDPETGELVSGGFEPQARRALENLRHVLAAAGCTFSDVVKANVYVTNLADFPTLNALYAEVMGDHRPARSTVQVAALPKAGLVEIDLVARLPED